MAESLTATCRTCGAPSRRARRDCRPCYYARIAARRRDRRQCPVPGCPNPRRDSTEPEATCRACYNARTAERAAAARTCPHCGGRKSHDSAQCFTCRVAKQRGGISVVEGVVVTFTASWLSGLMARPGVEWTPELLEIESGVAATTIRRWLSGRALPGLRELGAVLRALALEPCGHCGGTGRRDPTDERMRRFLRSAGGVVERESPAPTPLRTDALPRRLVSRDFVMDLTERRAWCRGREIDLTQREMEMLGVLLRYPGRRIRSVEVEAALDIVGRSGPGHVVRMAFFRLRKKLPAGVIGSSQQFGYWAEPAEPAAEQAG